MAACQHAWRTDCRGGYFQHIRKLGEIRVHTTGFVTGELLERDAPVALLIHISERLAVAILHNKAAIGLYDRPRLRLAARRHLLKPRAREGKALGRFKVNRADRHYEGLRLTVLVEMWKRQTQSRLWPPSPGKPARRSDRSGIG
jgi:hypothetical protein